MSFLRRIVSRRTKPRPGRLEGEDLEALRLACFNRDGWMCKQCKRFVWKDLPLEDPRRAHMAHIGAKRRHGDSLENVRTLCGDCHRLEHAYGKSMQKPCPPKRSGDTVGTSGVDSAG